MVNKGLATVTSCMFSYCVVVNTPEATAFSQVRIPVRGLSATTISKSSLAATNVAHGANCACPSCRNGHDQDCKCAKCLVPHGPACGCPDCSETHGPLCPCTACSRAYHGLGCDCDNCKIWSGTSYDLSVERPAYPSAEISIPKIVFCGDIIFCRQLIQNKPERWWIDSKRRKEIRKLWWFF